MSARTLWDSFDDLERGRSHSNTPPPIRDARPRRYTIKHAPTWSDAVEEPLTLAPLAQPMNTHQLLDRLLALAAADVSRARPTAAFVHAALLLLRARLDAESARAREAEDRANALVRRAKDALADAVAARADAAGAREAVRVHADVAERVGADTRRVQAELARVASERDAARQEADDARADAHRVILESAVVRAREDGHTAGFDAGVARGRRLGFDEGRRAAYDAARDDACVARPPSIVSVIPVKTHARRASDPVRATEALDPRPAPARPSSARPTSASAARRADSPASSLFRVSAPSPTPTSRGARLAPPKLPASRLHTTEHITAPILSSSSPSPPSDKRPARRVTRTPGPVPTRRPSTRASTRDKPTPAPSPVLVRRPSTRTSAQVPPPPRTLSPLSKLYAPHDEPSTVTSLDHDEVIHRAFSDTPPTGSDRPSLDSASAAYDAPTCASSPDHASTPHASEVSHAPHDHNASHAPRPGFPYTHTPAYPQTHAYTQVPFHPPGFPETPNSLPPITPMAAAPAIYAPTPAYTPAPAIYSPFALPGIAAAPPRTTWMSDTGSETHRRTPSPAPAPARQRMSGAGVLTAADIEKWRRTPSPGCPRTKRMGAVPAAVDTKPRRTPSPWPLKARLRARSPSPASAAKPAPTDSLKKKQRAREPTPPPAPPYSESFSPWTFVAAPAPVADFDACAPSPPPSAFAQPPPPLLDRLGYHLSALAMHASASTMTTPSAGGGSSRPLSEFELVCPPQGLPALALHGAIKHNMSPGAKRVQNLCSLSDEEDGTDIAQEPLLVRQCPPVHGRQSSGATIAIAVESPSGSTSPARPDSPSARLTLAGGLLTPEYVSPQLWPDPAPLHAAARKAVEQPRRQPRQNHERLARGLRGR